MFILSEVSDIVKIPPHTFHIPINEAVTNELHKKYANKVIANLGLVVAVWDLLEIHDGQLKPGDGASFVKVRFRCVVWKPFVGEILSGWVTQCTAEGIKIGMRFFDEIFVPKNYFFENCEFKPVEKAWVWKPDDETELYIDVNERVRFRVEEEVFLSIKPRPTNQDNQEEDNKVPPYALIASCQTDGMGCVSWWD